MKELKTCTKNEEGAKKAMLQNDEVLTDLEATHGHATWNIFKRKQFTINGITIISSLSFTNPSVIFMFNKM